MDMGPPHFHSFQKLGPGDLATKKTRSVINRVLNRLTEVSLVNPLPQKQTLSENQDLVC